MNQTLDPFAPASLGPLTLRNRIIKAATFEGMTRKHVVSDRLIEFHREMAAGGVGMTTVAYCAVSPDGCGTPNEVILTPDAVPGLRQIAEVVHEQGAAINAQIGHAGAVAAGAGYVGRSPSRIFSPLAMKFTKPLSPSEIETVIDQFAAAARVVADGGFDSIEVHLGHGYLPSEFLSPKLNRRTDEWGGVLENRARLSRMIVQAVRAAVGPNLAVIAKLNMSDGVLGGLWVDESMRVAKMLQDDGHLDALELTAGSSLENPMYLFRGEPPLTEMAAVMPRLVRPGFKLAGKFFLKSYPFEDCYLMAMARQFREALEMPLIALGGISNRDHIDQAMRDGFEFVAMGRALLREPDFVQRVQDDPQAQSLCIHCNKCMPTIYTGTHCVLRES